MAGSPAPEPLLALFGRAQTLGFLGPGPVAAHLDHASAWVEVLPPPDRAVDLGSGAGLPGLVLARAWPTSTWWLVEAGARRATWLRAAVRELGLDDRVTVLEERAEVSGRGPLRRTLDLVVARSFGPPAITAECGAPLLRVGGILAVSEPPEQDPDRWAGVADVGLGLGSPTVRPAGRGSVALLPMVGDLDDRFPRRDPRRRPLFGSER